MDLYSLPKDILVKLVATIREDVVKEYAEKLEECQENCREYRRLLNKITTMCNCSHEGCEAFHTYGFTYGYYKCDKFYYCQHCENGYCDNHISDYGLCEKCENTLVLD